MKKYEFSKQEKAVLEGLQQPFVVYQFIDDQIFPLVVSDGYRELFGYSTREIAYSNVGKDMYGSIHEDDVDRIRDAARKFAAEGGVLEGRFRARNRKNSEDSDYRMIRLSGRHLKAETGERLAHVWFFDEGPMRGDMVRRQNILANFDKALEEGWIQVHYQPIIRAVNGRVCNEEALSRWNDPAMGWLSPAEFIPVLEEDKVIYKLDLYVLERVLDKIRYQREAGLDVVPHSINLSRSDFETCDIVEEIRKRVDASGIERSMITIELTESIIGRDVDFMTEQIERFQKLGFPVWMDDFGTGYSSMDLLQTIDFDLLKFDMSFMKKLDEGERGKIILTELVKMATALGIDTICEGVETEAQLRFLKEIGCAKLQGFYYTPPLSLEKVMERYETGNQIGYEDPAESEYFETIGRIDLYDLNVIASEEGSFFQNFFNSIPIGIMEIGDGRVEYARTNQPYRDFIDRFFGFTVAEGVATYIDTPEGPGAPFMKQIRECCESGKRVFIDDHMPDGTTIHSFARRIARNPVSGKTAVAIAVLTINGAPQ